MVRCAMADGCQLNVRRQLHRDGCRMATLGVQRKTARATVGAGSADARNAIYDATRRGRRKTPSVPAGSATAAATTGRDAAAAARRRRRQRRRRRGRPRTRGSPCPVYIYTYATYPRDVTSHYCTMVGGFFFSSYPSYVYCGAHKKTGAAVRMAGQSNIIIIIIQVYASSVVQERTGGGEATAEKPDLKGQRRRKRTGRGKKKKKTVSGKEPTALLYLYRYEIYIYIHT